MTSGLDVFPRTKNTHKGRKRTFFVVVNSIWQRELKGYLVQSRQDAKVCSFSLRLCVTNPVQHVPD
jgi:hypothetical protein